MFLVLNENDSENGSEWSQWKVNGCWFGGRTEMTYELGHLEESSSLTQDQRSARIGDEGGLLLVLLGRSHLQGGPEVDEQIFFIAICIVAVTSPDDDLWTTKCVKVCGRLWHRGVTLTSGSSRLNLVLAGADLLGCGGSSSYGMIRCSNWGAARATVKNRDRQIMATWWPKMRETWIAGCPWDNWCSTVPSCWFLDVESSMLFQGNPECLWVSLSTGASAYIGGWVADWKWITFTVETRLPSCFTYFFAFTISQRFFLFFCGSVSLRSRQPSKSSGCPAGEGTSGRKSS